MKPNPKASNESARQLEDLPDDRANENQARERRGHRDAVESEIA